jgi:hypothetical protein
MALAFAAHLEYMQVLKEELHVLKAAKKLEMAQVPKQMSWALQQGVKSFR